MRSVDFPQRTHIIAEDQDEYENLYAHVDLSKQQTPVTVCFELNKEEIDEIVRTGKVWHTYWTFGRAFQPMSLTTQNPFENGDTQVSAG